MSTAAALRHLHSLYVEAPVFGLLWSDGSVRAHVDWCVDNGQEKPVHTMSTNLRKYHISSSVHNSGFAPPYSQSRAVTMAKGK
jgi:hypothetical protein